MNWVLKPWMSGSDELITVHRTRVYISFTSTQVLESVYVTISGALGRRGKTSFPKSYNFSVDNRCVFSFSLVSLGELSTKY